MLVPSRLRVEYKSNPLGMDEKLPRFSYMLEGDGTAQGARRIVVRRDDDNAVAWDSGFVASGVSVQIEYAGENLRPFTRYSWAVKVRDEKGGESEWSADPAFFETGFLGTRWSAKWITCAWGGSSNPLSRFLRDFDIGRRVRRARLYATALGVYDVFVNGEMCGEECLKPGWTDFYERVQYQAFDVTGMLREGANTLAAQVADGWYVGKGYGKCPMFIAELHIDYEDGSSEKIVTDSSWKAFYIHIQNPMRMGNIYNGEIYEAWEETDWKLPGGYRTYAVKAREAESSHPIASKIRIVWQSGPSLRHMHRMEPVSIVRRPNYTYLVDFGQNFAGRERIHLRNTLKGTTIVIKHGEMLSPDGSLYVENLRNAWQRTVYTCGTHDEEIYEPLYTFCGFRYLEISGWPGELTKDQICAFSIYSDLEKTGDFSCSEPLLNQLYSNIVWGQRSNFVDVPTDCPQRDERQGWTGDTQVFANMATYNMDCGAFYTKWLADLNYAADATGGGYPHVAPRTARETFDRECGAAGWGDAGIVCPRVMLEKYGDTRVVRGYFRNMVRWLDWRIAKCGGSPIIDLVTFGDWLNVDADCDRSYISTAYLAEMATELSAMARAIGENGEAVRLDQLGRDVRRAIVEKWFTPDGDITIKMQTAAVLALAFGLCPDEASRRKAVAFLKHDIVVERKLHLSTGFLGTPLLLRVLSENGETDLAYDLLLQTSYPGWLYPVTQGATTMWERWNSWTRDGGFCDPEMNSFNHYAYGAVGDWFFETICGIRPVRDAAEEERAFRRFVLSPQFGRRLAWAAASYRSAYGEIKSAWKRDGGTVAWTFTVPCNTSATVLLPAGFRLAASAAGATVADAPLLFTPGTYTLELAENE